MAFKDLDSFLVIKPLVLPIRGKEYAFPGELSAKSGLLLQRLDARDESEPDAQLLSDAEEKQLHDEILGDAEAQMVADGLTNTHIKVAFYALIAYHLYGLEAAEAVWNAQGEAIAPNRRTRRSKAPAKSTRSRGSRAASTVPKTKAPAGLPSSDSGS